MFSQTKTRSPVVMASRKDLSWLLRMPIAKRQPSKPVARSKTSNIYAIGRDRALLVHDSDLAIAQSFDQGFHYLVVCDRSMGCGGSGGWHLGQLRPPNFRVAGINVPISSMESLRIGWCG
jgi:hypothetical protein